ncbi:hypothetical protein SteCoe_8857 [Stentor coeruleus]|uniref:Uncharacterized protein n=1 Tax=Stentor coeruleus TaxID=5963 RepID=A0A1R2CJ56_9CILI|nr:hypothetical protein SteCoe_8857 [Stentor coeruleus]
MRRKRIRGIYTNKTVKKCSTCEDYCSQCKGPCKTFSKDSNIRALVWEDHTIPSSFKNKKTHRIGVGNYRGTKNFNFFNPRNHKRNRKSSPVYGLDKDFKNSVKRDLEDQLKCYEHEVFAESLRAPFKP